MNVNGMIAHCRQSIKTCFKESVKMLVIYCSDNYTSNKMADLCLVKPTFCTLPLNHTLSKLVHESNTGVLTVHLLVFDNSKIIQDFLARERL